MSKQTSVEWFVEQIKDYDFADIKEQEYYMIKIPSWVFTKKQEQAKAMEREQIINAYVEGCTDTYGVDEPNPNYIDSENAKDYYNQTYGGEQ